MKYVATSIANEEPVRIPVQDAALNGDLGMPDAPSGIVVFAHGSGSSRKSPRDRAVAAASWSGGFATLLLDLLTDPEERIDNGAAR